MEGPDSTPRILLIPVATPGRTELTRDLSLKYTQKVGRAIPNKSKPAVDNAIFDSKVLSRTHAEIWFDSGKVYIKDTKSSNGTYVNDERLSASGVESDPREIHSGDSLRLGVDVLENTAAHKCVQLTIEIHLAGDVTKSTAAIESSLTPIDHLVSVDHIASQGKDALITEVNKLRDESKQYHLNVGKLQARVTELLTQETVMKQQLAELSSIVTEMESSMESQRMNIMDREKLLSRITTLENQLAFYSNRAKSSQREAEAVVALKESLVNLENDKNMCAMSSKDSMQRLFDEKRDLLEKYQKLKVELSVTKSAHEGERQRLWDLIEKLNTREIEFKETIQHLTTTTSLSSESALPMAANSADNSSDNPAPTSKVSVSISDNYEDRGTIVSLVHPMEKQLKVSSEPVLEPNNATAQHSLSEAKETKSVSTTTDQTSLLPELEQSHAQRIKTMEAQLETLNTELKTEQERNHTLNEQAQESAKLAEERLALQIEASDRCQQLEQQLQHFATLQKQKDSRLEQLENTHHLSDTELGDLRARLENANEIIKQANVQVEKALANLRERDSEAKQLEIEVKTLRESLLSKSYKTWSAMVFSLVAVIVAVFVSSPARLL